MEFTAEAQGDHQTIDIKRDMMVESIEFFARFANVRLVGEKELIISTNSSGNSQQYINVKTGLDFLPFGSQLYLPEGRYELKMSAPDTSGDRREAFKVFLHGKSK